MTTRPVAWPVLIPGLTVVGAGLVVGIGTQMMQGVLTGAWSVLANSSVMWALTAFALGALLPTSRWAVGGGAAHLVTASCAYYQAVQWFEGSDSELSRSVIWSLAGVIAGAAFGLAGHLCVRQRAWRGPALALISGVLVGEGMHFSRMAHSPALRTAGTAELLLAGVFGATAFFAASGGASRNMRRGVATTAIVLVGAAWLTVGLSRVINAALATA